MFVLLWVIATPSGLTSGSTEFASEETALVARDWLRERFNSVSAEVFAK